MIAVIFLSIVLEEDNECYMWFEFQRFANETSASSTEKVSAEVFPVSCTPQVGWGTWADGNVAH